MIPTRYEPTFDDDSFDAEILVTRVGGSTFTAKQVGMMMGSRTESGARVLTQKRLALGRIPEVAFPGHENEPALWTKDQLVEIVADLLRQGGRVCVIAP